MGGVEEFDSLAAGPHIRLLTLSFASANAVFFAWFRVLHAVVTEDATVTWPSARRSSTVTDHHIAPSCAHWQPPGPATQCCDHSQWHCSPFCQPVCRRHCRPLMLHHDVGDLLVGYDHLILRCCKCAVGCCEHAVGCCERAVGRCGELYR